MSSTSPLHHVGASPAAQSETWSSFTQVVSCLQAYQHVAQAHDGGEGRDNRTHLETSLPRALTPAPDRCSPRKRTRTEAGALLEAQEALPSSPVLVTAPALPSPWSPEWVLLVYLKAILVCPLCGTLLKDNTLVVDTCGHCFCARCLLPALEAGCVPLRESWPYNVILFGEEVAPGEEAPSEAAVPQDLTALGAVLAQRLRTLTCQTAAARRGGQLARRARRPRKATFTCPLCGGPAFKWSTTRLPLLEQICIEMETNMPGLEARLRALATEAPALPSPLADEASMVDVISVSSGSATSLAHPQPLSSDDHPLSKFVSVTSIKTEPSADDVEPQCSVVPSRISPPALSMVAKALPSQDDGGHGAQTPPFSVPLFVAPHAMASAPADPVSTTHNRDLDEAFFEERAPPPARVPPSNARPAATPPVDAYLGRVSWSPSLALLGTFAEDADLMGSLQTGQHGVDESALPHTPEPVGRHHEPYPITATTTTASSRPQGAFRSLLYSDTP